MARMDEATCSPRSAVASRRIKRTTPTPASSGSASATSCCRCPVRSARPCTRPSTRWPASRTFSGYGPEQGYDFLREAIAENDFASRGVEVRRRDLRLRRLEVRQRQHPEIFAADARVAVPDPVYPVYVDTNVMAGRTGAPGRERALRRASLPRRQRGERLLPVAAGRAASTWSTSASRTTRPAAVADPGAARRVGRVGEEERARFCCSTRPTRPTSPIASIPHSIYEIPGAREVAIEFRSFSKTAGFTGVRCAYVVVPDERARRQGVPGNPVEPRHPSGSTACRTSAAAAEAVYGRARPARSARADRVLHDQRRHHSRRSRQARSESVRRRQRAVRLGEDPRRVDSWSFFDRLLDRAKVVGTPGAGFGACGEGYFRLSAFGKRENVEEAIERIRGGRVVDYRDSPEQARLREHAPRFAASAVRSRRFEDGWITSFDPRVLTHVGRGWLGMTWPKRYGGQERSYLDRLISDRGALLAARPRTGSATGRSAPRCLRARHARAEVRATHRAVGSFCIA